MLLNMDRGLLVSICVITYNHEKYISQALEGFFKQRVDFEYEILINDDCSTDKTQEIITEYQSRYPNIIKPIFQKANKYSQGERAINCRYNYPRAKGKYIAICDGDDFWDDPLKLQSQVDFLEKNENYVLTFQNTLEIDEDGKIEDYAILNKYRKDRSSLELKQGVYVFTSTICFRNNIKEYPDEIFEVVNEDTFITSLLGQFGGAKYLDHLKPSYYRIQSQGVWSTLTGDERLKHRLNTYKNLKEYYKRIGEKNMCQFFRKKLSSTHIGLFEYSISIRDFVQALTHFGKAHNFSIKPFPNFYFVIFKVFIKGLLQKTVLK